MKNANDSEHMCSSPDGGEEDYNKSQGEVKNLIFSIVYRMCVVCIAYTKYHLNNNKIYIQNYNIENICQRQI